MRLFFDTNVLIAAFVSRGVCHELLEHCARTHEVVVSPFVLAELRAKLGGKFRMPPEVVDRAATHLLSLADVVEPTEVPAVSRDPDDDAILAAAVAGGCHCLLTGDRDLLVLGQHQGVPILAPSEFWSFEARQR